MNHVSIIAGIVTALATFVAAVTTICVIMYNRWKEKHMLYLKLESVYQWFKNAENFCKYVFEAEESRKAVDIFEEHTKYKPKPNKNVLEICDTSQQYGYLLKRKNEKDLINFASLIRRFSYTFDFLISQLVEMQEKKDECEMSEFKKNLKQLYPRDEVNYNEPVDTYLSNEINEVKKAWKKVEMCFTRKKKTDE